MKELEPKSDAELTKELERLAEVVRSLTLKKKLGQLKSSRELVMARKDVARIKTVLTQRAA